MKYNFSIFLGLLLVTLIACEGANRLKSKSHSRAEARMKSCRQNYNIYVDGNECQYSVVDDFSLSATQNSEGLFFKTSDMKGLLSKIASVKNNKMYLPYRNMGAVRYDDNCWLFCSKTYSFTMTNDEKKVYNVIIYLDKNCHYDSENVADVKAINDARIMSRYYISQYRQESINYAYQYILESNNAAVQKKGKEAIEADIKIQQGEVNDLYSKCNTISATRESLKQKLNSESTELEKKLTELSALEAQLNQQGVLLKQKEAMVKELEASAQDSHGEATRLAERAAKAKLTYDADIIAFEKDSQGLYSTPNIKAAATLIGQCNALSQKLNNIVS